MLLEEPLDKNSLGAYPGKPDVTRTLKEDPLERGRQVILTNRLCTFHHAHRNTEVDKQSTHSPESHEERSAHVDTREVGSLSAINRSNKTKL